MKNKEYLLLTLILFLALVLRLQGIYWGLPNQAHLWPYHSDEAYSLLALSEINFDKGEFLFRNTFGWGQFYFYEIGFVLKTLSVLGFIVLKNSVDFYRQHVFELTKIYFCGRLFTVFWGMLSVIFIWWLGRRFLSQRVGLLAALFLSVLPFTVAHSHYMTVHMQFMALCILAMIFAGYIYEEPKTKWYIMFGITVGLAAGSYLFPGFTLFALLLAAYKRITFKDLYIRGQKTVPFRVRMNNGRSVFRSRKPRASARGASLLSLLIAILFFLITNPAIIFYWGNFIDQWRNNISMGLVGVCKIHLIGKCLIKLLPYGTGWVFFGAFLVSIIYSILNRNRFKTAFLIWGFSYYLFCSFFGSGDFVRRFSPLFPLMAIFVAELVNGIKKQSLRWLVCLLFFLHPFLYSLGIIKLMVKEDTRSIAYQWINKNLRPGSNIFVRRWFYVPHISVKRYNIIDKEAEKEKAEYWLLSNFDLKLGEPHKGYHLKQTFIKKPTMLGITFDDHNGSQDMRYTHPEIFIFEKS